MGIALIAYKSNRIRPSIVDNARPRLRLQC